MKNRDKTHCFRGHPLSGDNLKMSSHGYRVCRICRRLDANCKKLMAKKTYRYGLTANVLVNTGRERLESAFAAIRENGRIAAAYPILGKSRTRALVFFHPKVAALMHKLIADRPKIISAPAISLLRPGLAANLTESIGRAVSIRLPRDMRDDVISDMILAVIERRLRIEEIETRVGEFVRARFKIDHNKFGPRSLDVPIWIDSNTTLMETVTRGLWD